MKRYTTTKEMHVWKRDGETFGFKESADWECYLIAFPPAVS